MTDHLLVRSADPDPSSDLSGDDPTENEKEVNGRWSTGSTTTTSGEDSSRGSRSTGEGGFDPLDPDVLRDPYPTYRALRDASAVLWDERHRSWLVTGHVAAVETLSRLEAFGSDPSRVGESAPADARSIMNTDPPLHAAHRRAALEGLRTVRQPGELVQRAADEILDRWAGLHAVDIVLDYARPLAFSVMIGLLGLRAPEYDWFTFRSSAVVDAMDATLRPGTAEPAMAARQAVNDYLHDELQHLRKSPNGRPVDAMARSADLDAAELANTMRSIMLSGFEAPARLIGNAAVALLRNRTALEQLQVEPRIWETAVEELMRFDTPVQAVSRTVVQDTELAGRTLRRGEVVVVLLGAANHDPARFSEPDDLHIERRPNPHLCFGHGLHSCLGSSLVRLEIRIALSRLVERYPGIRLAAEPVHRPNVTMRGLDRLPVHLR